jgi:hypothetical protein
MGIESVYLKEDLLLIKTMDKASFYIVYIYFIDNYTIQYSRVFLIKK